MTNDGKPTRSFRESPWRYSQFVVVGLVVAGLLRWLATGSWPVALGVGAVAGVGYLLLEKKRGVI